MKAFSPDSFRVVLLGAGLFFGGGVLAQVPDAPGGSGAAPAAQPAPAKGAAAGGGQKNGSFLGRDIPFVDPNSETMEWDGKHWNLNNNRAFEARFEKYLNAEEETTDVDQKYQATITTILKDLAPGNASPKNIDAAFRLLPHASSFEIDARLCDTIADAVYSAWAALNSQNRLAAANDALDAEARQEYWNSQHVSTAEHSREAGSPGQSGRKSNGGGGRTESPLETFENTSHVTEHTKRLAEIEALKKANSLKREINSIQTKVDFQALIVQLFMQRRFQHVLMATRFYRAIFTDGDTKLNLSKEGKDFFEKAGGMPPTVGTLDSLANEALRDVKEGVQAYNYLLQQGELQSATKRLGEAFVEGEYVPEIRTLSREKKRKAVEFSRKSYQLISALDVKDYTLAGKLVDELTAMAKDFDSSKPLNAIGVAQRVSAMHIAKARNAALRGDTQTVDTEMAAATEIWPRNPALEEISNQIAIQGDVQQKAIIDFDDLLRKKDYRQIYEDSPRFMAALGLIPEKLAKLKEVVENMKVIEGAIMRADEMVSQSNYPGAWESVERIAQQFPEDTKLSKTRADLTPHAADFVRTLQDAQDREKHDQIGASLALYLKARKLYPQSDFAGDGIDRLVKKIIPES